MEILKRVSGQFFYALGMIVLLGVFCIRLSFFPSTFESLLSILDLPLLFTGCLFAGTSFLSTIAHPPSRAISILIWGLLSLFFVGCLTLNFAFPFQVYFGF